MRGGSGNYPKFTQTHKIRCLVTVLADEIFHNKRANASFSMRRHVQINK